jgi:hypothetical protein
MDQYIRTKTAMPKKSSYEHKHKTWFHTGMFQQKKFYTIPTASFMIYCTMRSYEVRGNVKSDLYKYIKKKYYEHGHIVCALSQREISDKMGWHRSKVTRYIKPLVKLKIVRIDEIDVGNQNNQHLYLLGRTDSTGDDRYFIDEFVNS